MSDSRQMELDEILEGWRSRLAFRVLRVLLDRWPDSSDRDEAIRRAEMALARSRWRARTLHVSAETNAEMSALLRQPSWRLVRSLWWVPLGDATTLQVVDSLASDPNAKYLRRLFLEYPSDDALHRLNLRRCFPNLVALTINLGCDNRRRGVIPFLNSSLPSSLRYLKLSGIDLLDDGESDDVPEVIDAIASSSVVQRLRRISLPNMSEATLEYFLERFRIPLSDIGHQTWTLESLSRFCHNRELASGLRRLDLLGRNLGVEGAALLARCPHFGRLEYLNLRDNSLGPKELAVLAGSSILPRLRWLSLSNNPLGYDGWEILSRFPLHQLRTLFLWDTDATAFGAGWLARTQNLRSLRRLIVSNNAGLGDEGISRVLNSPLASRLSYLNLANTGKSATTAATLARRPLRSLRALDLSVDRGGAEFSRQLARSSMWPSLRSLNLSGLGLGDEGVEYLARSHAFPLLRYLRLESDRITSRGVRALAGASFLSSIWDLSLDANPQIDDEGAVRLAESRFMRNLVGLNLSGTRVSQAALDYLKRSPNMRCLDIISWDADE